MTIAVVGLGYGDEGKGTITEALALRKNICDISRFSGGAQALHHVVLPDGRWHGFSQFTSGTFYEIKTTLGPAVIIAPDSMFLEGEILESKGVFRPLDFVTVDPDCKIATPWHRWLNRFKEIKRGSERRGSCGMGIGEAHRDKIMPLTAEVCGKKTLRADLKMKHAELCVKARNLGFKIPGPKVDEVYATYSRWAARTNIDYTSPKELLESSQGTLLSPDVNKTKNKTKLPVTANEARKWVPDTKVIGVTRAFMTRHGAGEFPTETYFRAAWLRGEHNVHNEWQGSFRIGHLDLLGLKHSISAGGKIDYLAVTCLDRVSYPLKIRTGFRDDLSQPDKYIYVGTEQELLRLLEEELEVPIAILSHGPTYKDKTFLKEV